MKRRNKRKRTWPYYTLKWEVSHPDHGVLLVESYSSSRAVDIAVEVWEAPHPGGITCKLARTRKHAEWVCTAS